MKLRDDGVVRKPNPVQVVECKYRWGVDCPKEDVKDNMCAFCGWNPKVQAQRVRKMLYAK